MKSFFSFRLVVDDNVEARQTQIRLNAFGFQLDGVIDFGECLIAFVPGIENAAHQNVAFDVIGILLQDLLRQSLGFSD